MNFQLLQSCCRNLKTIPCDTALVRFVSCCWERSGFILWSKLLPFLRISLLLASQREELTAKVPFPNDLNFYPSDKLSAVQASMNVVTLCLSGEGKIQLSVARSGALLVTSLFLPLQKNLTCCFLLQVRLPYENTPWRESRACLSLRSVCTVFAEFSLSCLTG